MEPIGFHIILRLCQDRVIAPSVNERRCVARSIIEKSAEVRLLVFRCVDTHIHILCACSRGQAGEVARRIELSLHRRLNLSKSLDFNRIFERARIVPVRDQRHLRSAFHYILRQEDHHDSHADPFHEGSNLPDLLGLRLLGAHTRAHVQELLPRIRLHGLWNYLGLDGQPEPPTDWQGLDQALLGTLAKGRLSLRRADDRIALSLAASMARPGMSKRQLARTLGLSQRQLMKLDRPPPRKSELSSQLQQMEAALRGQLALRAWARHASDRPIPTSSPAGSLPGAEGVAGTGDQAANSDLFPRR